MLKVNPEKGDFVKILFKGISPVEEGIVVSWDDDRAVIKAFTSNNVLIIMKPEENVIAVQVLVEQRKPLDIAHTEELKPDKYYKREDLRALSLVRLRQLEALEEKKRARELLTTFEGQGLSKVDYNNPSDILIKRKR